MKALITLWICCAWLQMLVAQDSSAYRGFEARLSGELFDTPLGYHGEQYYLREWVNGTILLESGELVRDKKLKYNGFLDQLIWFDLERNRMVKLDKAFIREFTLEPAGGKPLLFRRIRVSGFLPSDTLEVFAEVLAEGAASLFVQRRVIIRGSSTLDLGDRQYIYDELLPHPRYILVLPDRNVVTFNRIRKRLILAQLPPAWQEPFRESLKEVHSRLRNERQLAELVKGIR